MIRQHDVHVVAEGTFRVVLTNERRVAAVIDIAESALGPLHLVYEVMRSGLDLGGGSGAERAFHSASEVASTVARPSFSLARDAAASGAQLLANAPFLSEHEHDELEAASRIILRARLGDLTARDFLHSIVQAARTGAPNAQRAGDALLSGARVVDHVLDAPLKLAESVPLLGGPLHALDPLQKLTRVSTAIQQGDFGAVRKLVIDDPRGMPSAQPMVPGIGSGLGNPIRIGLAVLDQGGALDEALHAAYASIPIPPGARPVTDNVLAGVLSLAHRDSVTDAALASARSAVPSGLPRDVFDSLVQLIIKRVHVQRVGASLVDHYVNHYAQSDAPLSVSSEDKRARAAAAATTPAHVADFVSSMPRLPAASFG